MFTRLLTQLIRLRTHFPDYQIRKICVDNVSKFTLQAFNDYYLFIWIDVEHSITHVHTQNGLALSFIKCLQLIVRPLLMRSNLPISDWRHAILHALALIHIKQTSYHKSSHLQLVFGQEPNISHLIIFGYAIYVPISLSQEGWEYMSDMNLHL